MRGMIPLKRLVLVVKGFGLYSSWFLAGQFWVWCFLKTGGTLKDLWDMRGQKRGYGGPYQGFYRGMLRHSGLM